MRLWCAPRALPRAVERLGRQLRGHSGARSLRRSGLVRRMSHKRPACRGGFTKAPLCMLSLRPCFSRTSGRRTPHRSARPAGDGAVRPHEFSPQVDHVGPRRRKRIHQNELSDAAAFHAVHGMRMLWWDAFAGIGRRSGLGRRRRQQCSGKGLRARSMRSCDCRRRSGGRAADVLRRRCGRWMWMWAERWRGSCS